MAARDRDFFRLMYLLEEGHLPSADCEFLTDPNTKVILCHDYPIGFYLFQSEQIAGNEKALGISLDILAPVNVITDPRVHRAMLMDIGWFTEADVDRILKLVRGRKKVKSGKRGKRMERNTQLMEKPIRKM